MNRGFTAVVTCCILLCSCVSPHNIHMKEVNQQHWPLNDQITVTYPNHDSTTLRDINIILRINSDFEYDKLNLLMCTVSPDGRRWNDTISVTNLDQGSLNHSHTDIERPIRHDVTFPQTGNYLFIFKHLMPKTAIKGITSIGVNIK